MAPGGSKRNKYMEASYVSLDSKRGLVKSTLWVSNVRHVQMKA